MQDITVASVPIQPLSVFLDPPLNTITDVFTSILLNNDMYNTRHPQIIHAKCMGHVFQRLGRAMDTLAERGC